VWIAWFSAIALVVILAALLLLLDRLVEEKELEARFGSEYLECRQHTPFMLPRLHRRS
jgi:protein-S-isoprenylcysteine O-methyltransferase Ste14